MTKALPPKIPDNQARKAGNRHAAMAPPRVPVHYLGISQILAYGLLFYGFAALKPYLSAASGLSEAVILALISASMIVQGLLMPVIGDGCDRFGALKVMSAGFLLGAIGMFFLGLIGTGAAPFIWQFVSTLIYVGGCLLLISLALGLSAYEVAFSAAVQLDEVNSRKQISIISFYGGVASSLAWVSLLPLLSLIGLFGSTSVVAAILASASIVVLSLSRKTPISVIRQQKQMAPFRWQLMKPAEQKSLILLSLSGGIHYVFFAATTIFLISWFDLLFDDMTLAVFLASLFGPFQVVGRYLEMRFGHHIDARLTGLIAYVMMPLSLWLVQIPSVTIAVIAMMLFGMSNGILTVTYGFVTNLYFRAEIYGRAKGWTSMLRVLGMGIGPSVGGWLFASQLDHFMTVMIILSFMAGVGFAALLWLKPTNDVHSAS